MLLKTEIKRILTGIVSFDAIRQNYGVVCVDFSNLLSESECEFVECVVQKANTRVIGRILLISFEHTEKRTYMFVSRLAR